MGQHFGLAQLGSSSAGLTGVTNVAAVTGGLTGIGLGSLNLTSNLCSTRCHSSPGFFTCQSRGSKRGQAPKVKGKASACNKASHISVGDRGHLKTWIQDDGVDRGWGS